jgi:tripartite-type tricarboxylate transporter receptor subunit TctC
MKRSGEVWRCVWFVLAHVCVMAAGLPGTRVQAQDGFYRGKTVSVVVGSKNGTLAIGAQIVARHIGRHIPGQPNSLGQQMPGGAHLIATNYVYNVAPPDGLTILAVNPQVAMAELTKAPAVRFEVRRFEWLGSSGSDGVLLGIRSDLPYQSFADLKLAATPLIAGATAPGSNSFDFPLLLKVFAGAPFKLVTGYGANTDIFLAVQRKEADAWTALGSTVKLAAAQGIVRPVVRARTKVMGFDHLPVDEDLVTDPVGKGLMAIRGIPLSIGRAFGVRPGTPRERVDILRQALALTVADPIFQAEAQTAGIEIEHIPAGTIERNFAELMNQPPAVLAAMAQYLRVGE